MLAHLRFVLRSVFNNRLGASSTEYAVVASLISVAAIVAMRTIGEELQNKLIIVASGFS
jgi:Flp pilus assembly pilin Flp